MRKNASSPPAFWLRLRRQVEQNRLVSTSSHQPGVRMSSADDRFAIIAALDRYAECLDNRDWNGLADALSQDVAIHR